MDNPTAPAGIRLRIVLADDHPAFRQRVRQLLRNIPGIELVGEAEHGEQLIRLAAELEPDIMIMDVVMPRLNGLEATLRIKRELPSIKVIVLSLHGDCGFRRALLEAGASTYLLKDNVGHELPRILRSILAGTA